MATGIETTSFVVNSQWPKRLPELRAEIVADAATIWINIIFTLAGAVDESDVEDYLKGVEENIKLNNGNTPGDLGTAIDNLSLAAVRGISKEKRAELLQHSNREVRRVVIAKLGSERAERDQLEHKGR